MIDVNELQKIMNNGIVYASANTAAIIPDGMRLESLEKFAAIPNRSRGVFRASSLEAVLDYANEEPNDNVRVFCGDKTVTAILNFYDGDSPGWKDNLAIYEAEKSAALLALKGITGTVRQENIVEYIDDWMPLLSFSRAGKPVSVSIARRLFANLTIDQVRKSSSDMTETFSGGDNTPDTMVVRAATVEGQPAVDITCSLCVSEIDGTPAAAVRIIGEKAMEEREKIAFRQAVKEMFDNFVVFSGNYSSNQFTS